jgi:pimeloyl-ACP methyl ester carboxylesterase
MLQEQIFIADGIKMVYYEAGNGPTILFIHGVGIRALTYRKTIQELAKNFHVLAPDLPGFGNSDMPKEEWDFIKYADFLSKFLVSQNVESVIILGHSLGGRIAIELAYYLSKKVSHLILVDSSPLNTYYSNGKFHLTKLIFKTSLEILIEHNPEYAKIVFDNLFNLKKNKFSYLKFKKAIDKALKSESLAARHITIPTLILWGKSDKVISPVHAYELQKEIADSHVKILPGNHAWCFTKPQVLATEVSEFTNKSQA